MRASRPCARTTCSTLSSATVASGWEKGRRREERAGQPPAHLDGGADTPLRLAFTELNAWLGERCRALWHELRHPSTKRSRVAEMLELEQTT